MNDEDRIKELVFVEKVHALGLIRAEDTFDNLAAAAETLARAANRLAPEGHRVTVARESR